MLLHQLPSATLLVGDAVGRARAGRDAAVGRRGRTRSGRCRCQRCRRRARSRVTGCVADRGVAGAVAVLGAPDALIGRRYRRPGRPGPCSRCCRRRAHILPEFAPLVTQTPERQSVVSTVQVSSPSREPALVVRRVADSRGRTPRRRRAGRAGPVQRRSVVGRRSEWPSRSGASPGTCSASGAAPGIAAPLSLARHCAVGRALGRAGVRRRVAIRRRGWAVGVRRGTARTRRFRRSRWNRKWAWSDPWSCTRYPRCSDSSRQNPCAVAGVADGNVATLHVLATFLQSHTSSRWFVF